MGWLRDLMSTSENGLSSFGKLAALALAHPQWPAECRIQNRSLSTLFSKLDRGQDMDWLRDRPLVQRTLAQLMGRPVADIQLHLDLPAGPDDGRQLRWLDLRYARAIDLCKEALPPGIPTEVLVPPSWQPTWWRAPRGAGKSIVGAWLAARGLAQHVTITDESHWKSVPSRGALFIELGNDCEVRPEHLAPLRWKERPLCFAAHASPREASAKTLGPSLLIIDSPSVSSILPELVHWVSSHLNGQGQFDEELAERWMKRVALPLGAAETLGDALGLLGVLDETAPRALNEQSLQSIAEAFLTTRLRETAEDNEPLIAKSAFLELREAAARCLLEEHTPLSRPRAIDDWTALLRRDRQGSETPDPSWFGAALANGLPLSRKDLRRVTRSLPPGAYQLTRALERARLLRPERKLGQPPRFVLGPHFLVRLLESQATHEALRQAPQSWGQALLHGSQAESVVAALVSQARQAKFSVVHSALDAVDDGSSACVAALEACVIALGLAQLEGVPVPDDLTADLVREVAANVVPFEDGVEPRFVPARHLGVEEGATAAPFYQLDVWRVCWLALSESTLALPRAVHPLHVGPGALSTMLDASRRLAHTMPSLAPALACLLDRSLRVHEEPHPSPPSRLLDQLLALEAGGDEGIDRQSLLVRCADLQSWGGIGALLRLIADRKIKPTKLYAALWDLYAQERSPLCNEPPAVQAEFWRAASWSTIDWRQHQGLPVAWESLLPHQYSSWLTHGTAAIPREAAAYLPLDAAVTVWASPEHGRYLPAALSKLLERAPSRFCSSLQAALEMKQPERLAALLSAACESATSEFVAAFPPVTRLLELPPDRLNLVRRFLLDCMQRRLPASPDAARLLDRIESSLLSLRFSQQAKHLPTDVEQA